MWHNISLLCSIMNTDSQSSSSSNIAKKHVIKSAFRPISVTSFFTVECSHVINLSPLQISSLSVITSQHISLLSMICSLIIQQIEILSTILRARSLESSRDKIIAVNDVNKNIILFMIKYLYHHIIKHSKLDVRIFHETSVQSQNFKTTDLLHYTWVIQNWNMLWNAYIELSISIISESALQHESTTVSSIVMSFKSQIACVNIIPFSSLMSTERAASQMPITDAYSDENHWRWLAGYWRGCPRPDITINISDSEGTLKDREVLRIWGHNMNTLVVTKANSGHVVFTAKQFRRVGFEVEEWLRDE